MSGRGAWRYRIIRSADADEGTAICRQRAERPGAAAGDALDEAVAAASARVRSLSGSVCAMFSITCVICAEKSSTATLPSLYPGVPDTKINLPTLTMVDTGMPLVGLPKCSNSLT